MSAMSRSESSGQRLPRAIALTSRSRLSGRSGRTSFRDEP
jgi:hypothetical protein